MDDAKWENEEAGSLFLSSVVNVGGRDNEADEAPLTRRRPGQMSEQLASFLCGSKPGLAFLELCVGLLDRYGFWKFCASIENLLI